MPLVDHRRIDQDFTTQPPRSSAPHRDGLLRRARHLQPQEKLLVELAFKNQLSHRQIAQILHVPAGTISRRLGRVCRLLRDPMILALLENECELPAETRALAIAHFLHRRSAAQLAGQHARSEGEVLRLLEYVRGWYRGVTCARQRAMS